MAAPGTAVAVETPLSKANPDRRRHRPNLRGKLTLAGRPTSTMSSRGAKLTSGLLVLLTLLFLTLTASAMAWQPPTHGQRVAITRAVNSTLYAPRGHKNSVSEIHVSTVGPWASVVVTYNYMTPPASVTAILQRRGRQWTLRSLAANGTTTSALPGIQAVGGGEWCVMPAKDVQDLGFPAGQCH
jgi:hypothetical protein